jgi:hypothetical protein
MTMDRIHFACFFYRWQQLLGIHLDQDIVGLIYDYYERSLENYTLLELIGALKERGIKITCPWNKRAIIKMISEEKLIIPPKYQDIEGAKAAYRYNCIYVFPTVNTRRCIDNLFVKYKSDYSAFRFQERDVIQFADGTAYNIAIKRVQDVLSVQLTNTNNICDEMYLDAEQFINMLESDDITILQNVHQGHFIQDI